MSMTVAQKGSATRAARAEESVCLEDIAFIAKNVGPRQAKTTAKKNAASFPQEDLVQDDEEIEEPQVKSKPKGSKTLRKYAPPPIAIDSESEPDLEPLKKQETVQHIDFTNLPLPVKSKAKATAKVVAKPVTPKATKAVPAPVVSSKNVKVVPATRKSAKLVAESASEDEQVTSEEPSDESDLSDVSGAQNDNNEGPNDKEFANELPQVICAKAHVSRTAASESGMDSDESHEIEDQSKSERCSQAKSTNGPANFFESDKEMPDAPSRFTVNRLRAAHSSEYALDVAIADALVGIPHPTRAHSRRSSTGSGWSSGMDLTIPDSEPDSGGDSEPDTPAPAPAAPRKPNKVSTAQRKKADLEKPKVRAPPAWGPAPGGKVALVIDIDRPESS
ncbi:hypothetical protein B0H17DRAFT_1193678 [Mycena rosella]|uniref:Uncharacterized protein n=1 Tax=Mycena rosella TaxID=1033263 RepID=A0AAD7GSS3_MYCRO|nr:hypothetical protein B0H17DRAFT_1193678 [Mycena rosella]